MPIILLGDAVVALLAVLVIFAAVGLGYLASKLVPNLPIIGGALRSAVVGVFNSMASTGRAWANGSAVFGAFVIQGTALALWWACYYLDVGINRAVLGVQTAEQYAASLYNDAIGYANTVYVNAVHAIQSIGTQVDGAIVRYYDAAISEARALYNDAIGVIQSYYNQAVAHANALYNQAIGYVNNEVGAINDQLKAVESVFAGDLSTAVKGLDAAITAAETKAVAEVSAAVAEADATAKALSAAAASGLSTALDATAADVVNPGLALLAPAVAVIAPAIPVTVADALGLPAIATGERVAGLSAALGALTGVAAATATEVADCLVPNCANLNTLSNLFNDLSEAALWSLILALVVEAATHPDQALQDLQDTVATPVQAMAQGIVSLVGAA